MSDLLSKAGAMREIANALDYVPDSDAVVTTLIRSCEELTGGGSAHAALKLLELTDSIRGSITDAWRIRFEITRANALRLTGDYETSLRICRSMLTNDGHHLAHLREQYIQLRIAEGAALWHLNACD